jgi:UDP-2,3-diacylglucosamine pyrophosphatase LpxH
LASRKIRNGETEKRRRKENMKITNSKSQITNKFQITMTKIPKINKKRITMIIMGHDINKQSTMFDRV